MLQNSACGVPMLDGNPVYPAFYSRTLAVDKMDVVSEPQLNNNNSDMANRNSSSMIASSRQWFTVGIVSSPGVDRDALYCPRETNRTMFIPEQTQRSQDTQNNYLQAPVAVFQTDDNNTSLQLNDKIVLQTAEKKMPVGTWQQSLVPHAQTSTGAVEAAKPTGIVTVVTKTRERRPMNAFLLFCKKHRPVLKKTFREENRAITKKLGKWWKMLTVERQKPYQKLAEKYKTKYLNVNPSFRWCKSATATVSSAAAEPSLGEGKTVGIATEPESDAISQDRLEAAQILVNLSATVEDRGLSFQLADDSNMGLLNELCDEKRRCGDRAGWQPAEYDDEDENKKHMNSFLSPSDVGLIKESRFNGVSTPVPSSSGVGKLQDQGHYGAENTGRTARTCKGKKYDDFMNRIYPRAQSKRATISKKTQTVLNGSAKAASEREIDAGCIVELTEVQEKIKQLEMERDKELSNICAYSIDQFLAIQHSEKRRKKSKSFATKAVTKVAISPTSPDNAVIQVPISAPDNIVPERATIEKPAAKLVGCQKRKPPRNRIIRLSV